MMMRRSKDSLFLIGIFIVLFSFSTSVYQSWLLRRMDAEGRLRVGASQQVRRRKDNVVDVADRPREGDKDGANAKSPYKSSAAQLKQGASSPSTVASTSSSSSSSPPHTVQQQQDEYVKNINNQVRKSLSRPKPWSKKPKGWETYGFHRTRRHFKCKLHAHDQTKPLPSLEDWKFLIDTYRDVVNDTSTKFDDPIPPTDGYTLTNERGERTPAPLYASRSETRGGRGLFASRDIREGELVMDGASSDYAFPDAMSWRRFVFTLAARSGTRKKACDVIDWCWTQQTEKSNGKYRIFSAMNISILLNGGDEGVWNVNPRSKLSSKFYATRDIKKDEELLTDYYIYDTFWDEVGLDDDDDDDDDVGGDGAEDNRAASEGAENEGTAGDDEDDDDDNTEDDGDEGDDDDDGDGTDDHAHQVSVQIDMTKSEEADQGEDLIVV